MASRTFSEESPFHLALGSFSILGLAWAVQVIRAPMPLEPALPEPAYASAGVLARIVDRHPIPRPIERAVTPAGDVARPRPAATGKATSGRTAGAAPAPMAPLPQDPAGVGAQDFEDQLARAVASVATHGESHDELRLRAGRPPGDDADAPVLAITRGEPSASTRTEPIAVRAGGAAPVFRAAPTPESTSVGALLRRYRGRVEACASAATRRNPGLRGRVELAWTIEAGRAYDVHVRANQTGDDELAGCLRQTLLGIRYSGTDGETSASYAWVFATD